jgi:hypothetical protein
MLLLKSSKESPINGLERSNRQKDRHPKTHTKRMIKMKFWTKKNVEKMQGSQLIEWNNQIVPDLDMAKKLGVEMKSSEKAYKLLQAEMKKRGII